MYAAKTALERDGHTVETRTSGTQLTDTLCRWADCILLDVMMPGEDGFAVCRRIRAETDAPILFLTARTDEPSVLTGLWPWRGRLPDQAVPHSGAACAGRSTPAGGRTAHHPIRSPAAGWRWIFPPRKPALAARLLHLTKSEYAICELLALHAGQTFSKEQIYEAVFGYDGTADDTAITQQYQEHPRQTARGRGREVLQTIWGVGYQWQNEN